KCRPAFGPVVLFVSEIQDFQELAAVRMVAQSGPTSCGSRATTKIRYRWTQRLWLILQPPQHFIDASLQGEAGVVEEAGAVDAMLKTLAIGQFHVGDLLIEGGSDTPDVGPAGLVGGSGGFVAELIDGFIETAERIGRGTLGRHGRLGRILAQPASPFQH